jgi:hypothetical protein
MKHRFTQMSIGKDVSARHPRLRRNLRFINSSFFLRVLQSGSEQAGRRPRVKRIGRMMRSGNGEVGMAMRRRVLVESEHEGGSRKAERAKGRKKAGAGGVFARRVLGVSLGFALWFAAGCGGDGIARHQVSGKVTYLGQEVQDGALVFEPDASVGQIAPTSFAQIRGGTYQTKRDDSPTTGKYKVRVMGYDKSKMRTAAGPGDIIEMPELFPEFALDIEVPVPGGRLDIDVPDSRSRGKRK